MNRLMSVVRVLVLGLAVSGSFAAAQGAEKIVIDGSTTVGPIAKAFAQNYMDQNKDVNITVSESGSGNGAKSLINNACQVATMSRFMKPEEFKAAVYNNITPVAHVIALDGIAVIVHPSNPVKALTLAQARDIYTGKVTNWKELGGPDVKIVIISRDTNSGTYETFEAIVLKGAKIAGGAEYVGSNGAVRDRVQNTPAAVGYVGVGFLDDSVKALSVDGVTPSKETVQSGHYPISRPLYMFTNGYPKLGSHLYSFVTFYLSKKGQEIVEEVGFVPVTNY